MSRCWLVSCLCCQPFSLHNRRCARAIPFGILPNFAQYQTREAEGRLGCNLRYACRQFPGPFMFHVGSYANNHTLGSATAPFNSAQEGMFIQT